MCSACGILEGGSGWVDSVGAGNALPHDRLAERRRRLLYVNMLLEDSGVFLREHGRQLVLRSATGTTRMVTDLAHVWRVADEIGRMPADPLHPHSPIFSEERSRC